MKGEFKHQYLIRLITTALVLCYIPLIICFGIFFPRSYNELLAAREDHFEELTRLFCQSFERQVAASYNAAFQLGLDSRDSGSPAFILSSPLFNRNPYYYLECIKAIDFFDRTPGLNMGIYFPDADCLFTRDSKYTADTYIANGLAIRDTLETRKFLEFLKKSGEDIKFCSTVPTIGERGQLFMGIPARFGTIREEALVFFIMEPDFFSVSDLYPSGGGNIQFLVFNTPPSELLYSTGRFFPLEFTESIYNAGVSGGLIHAENVRYRFFSMQGALGFTFASIMPFDLITTYILAFVTTMTKIGVVAGGLILLFLGLMVFVNYRPIGHLADELSERNRLIMDLLLRNLLYGLPIPPREAEELGLRGRSAKFFVVTVFDQKFRSEDRKALISGLHEKLSVTCYITDILYQDYEVIVCVSPRADTEPVREYLKTLILPPGSFETGPVVASMDEVKISYQACLEQRYGKEPHRSGEDAGKQGKPFPSPQKAQNFRDDVIRYVEEQYNNPQISQISVADHFGISIYSLSRLFNNDIGIGFAEFITAKRMEAAGNLLLRTDRDIIEIARTVGLLNTNYFSRLFKTHFGDTPTHYRLKVIK